MSWVRTIRFGRIVFVFKILSFPEDVPIEKWICFIQVGVSLLLLRQLLLVVASAILLLLVALPTPNRNSQDFTFHPYHLEKSVNVVVVEECADASVQCRSQVLHSVRQVLHSVGGCRV
jgi:hypothetical protein